tara:strand:- start:60 stop:242 length:183 start_codon:yes stop_codon:yes gene_type:complete
MKKPKIKIEEFLKDVDNVLNLVSKIDNIDPDTVDIEKLQEEIKKTDKFIKNKYKDLDVKE